ncbi:hypothetical protein [Zunongwangia sp. H14]|uniref:hypothetical protein n=1 Tax=Zunongwangia sp. H14 TaxID=3240792 RepID=UPI003566057C
MAEIEIEKKKPVWPWILLAVLIIAAILYFLVFADDDEPEEIEEVTTEQVIEEEPAENTNMGNMAAVEEYSNYIDNPDMGMDHEYTNGALLKLISAVEATADSANVNVDADIAEARSKAEDITEDASELTHADKIKNSGEIIVRAMHTIQTEEFPDLQDEYTEVETA